MITTIMRFGDRATWAIEVGDEEGGLRVVDLWAAGRRLTTKDHFAYVPSLVHHMGRTAGDLRAGRVPPNPFPDRTPQEIFELLRRDRTEFRERFWFLRWTEIVDNIDEYAYLDAGEVVLLFVNRHQGPEVSVARIPAAELLATIEAAVGQLSLGPGA